MLKSLLQVKSQLNAIRSEHEGDAALNKAIRISKLNPTIRTSEEIKLLMNILSRFDIFQRKVPPSQMDDVLRIAATQVKYLKVPAGHFLYHVGKNHLKFT